MKLYNTLTKKIDEFIPNDPNLVKMYTCGPTVYHFAHIGNLRSYIMEDVLEKAFLYLGYKVDRVMNITDVGHLTGDSDSGEDKMVKGAKRENKSVLEIADYYTGCFFKDIEKLNIKKPEKVVKATSLIADYIEIISELIEKGYAYKSGGNIYFDTSKLKNYYQLTNDSSNSLKEAARDEVEIDANKRNKTDFVLWFTKSKFDNQELKWDSPFGLGYPGWHIECSTISIKYLGEQLDIHCGGVDNIFPHHTNEIAQSESYLDHKWCNYWFHVNYLSDANGKMSKSSGDFLTLSLLEEKGYNPLSYRYFVLGSNYMNTLDFSYDSLEVASNAYSKLKKKITAMKNEGDFEEGEFSKFREEFVEAINNNLNTSNMLTVLHDVLKSAISNKTKLKLIEDFDKVLSLDLLKNEKVEIGEDIKKLVEERDTFKQNKDYQAADKIREELLDMGYIVKDTKEGTVLERVE